MKPSGRKLTAIAAAVALIGQAVGVSVLSTGANAADMLGNPEAEYTNVEFGTGWYLRGDVGGGTGAVSIQTSFVDAESDLGTPVTFGVGAGRTFSEGIRLEANFNQFNNLAFAQRAAYPDCGTEDHDNDVLTPPIAVTGDCYVSINARVNASNLMANAYMDLGSVGGFTPYLGGGLGIAYMSWNNFTFSDHCAGASATDCGSGAGVGLHTRYEGEYTTENSLTWAANAMAGVSYDLSKELKLDIGYRFTYLGEAGVARAADNSGITRDMTIGNTQIHEVRVGLRYEIW